MRAPDTSELAELIGIPFVYGGRGPAVFDCYGLVKWLYAKQGVLLPDYRSPNELGAIGALMVNQLQLWAPCAESPGVVVVIKLRGLVSHCGVTLPNHKFVHAWEGSGGVVIEPLSVWQKRIHGFYEYVGNH